MPPVMFANKLPQTFAALLSDECIIDERVNAAVSAVIVWEVTSEVLQL
jgi:hypothetical protein